MKQIKTLTLLLLVFAFSSCVKDVEVPIREYAIETDSITDITTNSAKCGGSIPDGIGASILSRGVCWSTSQNPTIENTHTTDGSVTGAFSSSITELTINTTYYVRAYATNNRGTFYGEAKIFKTQNGMASVTTNTVNNITATTASCGGNVTSDGGFLVTVRGVCWSTSQNPTIANNHTTDSSGTGVFTSSITGLTMNTTYYVRAYATNSNGTYYGEQRSFQTQNGIAVVTTNTVGTITATTASCGGNVTSDGGFPVTARGVCWSTSQNPTIASSHTTNGNGTGTFTSSITGLTKSTTYYVRAYVTNSNGTYYGVQRSFQTQNGMASVTTNTVSNITATTASCGGNVTSDGGFSVTARGVCWSTSQNPTIENTHTTNGSGTGTFTSSITGLTMNTTYYVRAYATNSNGTSYGEQRSFQTQNGLAVVTTNTVTSVTATTASCGGNVTSDGGFSVTARGVCWSTSQNPTIENTHTTDGSGTSAFTSSITGLTMNTTYYVRAYATNSNGTSYGEQRSFSTQNGLAVVTTNTVTSVTATTASCGGNVTSDGGFSVTARGVCWSTSANPTIANSHTTDGSGTGAFTSSITGLTINTTYYVRAYATNSNGTSYGEQRSFKIAEGVIYGLFSVSSTKKVYFSKGNLQYRASSSTWRFAEKQYDIIGNANSNISSFYSGWIDLFGWGTSGYNNKYPYMTSTTSTDYGNGNNNISGTNYDWGVYIGNSISNGASASWRTLTNNEWVYLIQTRANAASKYGLATVNGVTGLVLLPDTWTLPSGCSFTSGYGSGFTTNNYSVSQWTSMESAGAVFLPAAGHRYGTIVEFVGMLGGYWSSTYGNYVSGYVYDFGFNSSSVVPNSYNERFYGRSVRLAQDF